MSPIKSNLINQSHETNAHYVSIWERLPDALSRIIIQTGMPEAEAQIALCQAISDGAVGIRGKLGTHTTRHRCASNTVLEGADFSMPAEIKPEDLDWERSRPIKPWIVRQKASRTPGYWLLDWLELSRADVTNVFHTRTEDDLARSPRSVGGQTKKRNPGRERAFGVIKELYPQGVPDQAILPNTLLCRQVGEKLKEKNLPGVSDDTILRAAGRRK